MDNYPYRSLTHLLEDTKKNRISQFDKMLTIVGSYHTFNDSDEFTLEEINNLYQESINNQEQDISQEGYDIGRHFYSGMLPRYTRYKGKSDTLTNRKAKILRKKEKELLENLIKGEEK